MSRYPLAILLAAAGLSAVGCGEETAVAEPPVRPVKTVVLGESTVTGGRVFPGTLRAAERAQLSFRVSGPLVQFPVTEGMQVQKGQLLAQIDPRDFETAVKNIEAEIAALRAERRAMERARPEDIRRLQANLAAAKARLLEAEATFRRYQRLYENGNVSKAEYDQRRAARDVAEAEVQAAEEALQVALKGARPEDIEAMDARIRGAEARLQKAKNDLEDTTLRAPYAGIVAETFVENYEFVAAKEPILSLQNIETMELVAQIPETVVAKWRKESLPRFYATFPALPGARIPAKATEIAAEADPITRTYSVIFQVRQPEQGLILAGMTGEIHIETGDAETAGFSVPVAAVFTDENGDSCVWVLDKSTMTVRKAKVRVGEMVGESVLLLDGVKEGDTIVTAGASYLVEGQKVRKIVSELRERR